MQRQAVRYHNANIDCVLAGSHLCSDSPHHFIIVSVKSLRFYMKETPLKLVSTKEPLTTSVGTA